MNLLNNSHSHSVETVFDHAVTDDERMRLGIPTREAYLELFEGDTASVNASPLQSSLTLGVISMPVLNISSDSRQTN